MGWGDGAMDQGSQRNLGGGIGTDTNLNKKIHRPTEFHGVSAGVNAPQDLLGLSISTGLLGTAVRG